MHYYPFGSQQGGAYLGEMQPYKYNGKELDKMHGLNLYDYSARYYDPAIGRFTTVDPLAEKYYSISPYAYVANNPIKFIDKDGRSFDFPPVGGSPADYQRIAASKYIDNTIRRNASTIQRNGIKEVALSSDLNDATVITTAITRRGNAINIDGTPAGGVDMGFTALGAVIPFVSGSAVKGFFKSIGKALGIGGNTAKSANKAGNAVSPNVRKVLNSLDELKAEGGIVTPNTPLKSSQE